MVGMNHRNAELQAPSWSSTNTEDVMSLAVPQSGHRTEDPRLVKDSCSPAP